MTADPRQAATEQWVLELCRGFGLTVPDASTDFFATGATSLTAVRLIARVEEEFGEDSLPPDELYERSTIAQIASTIECHRRIPDDLAADRP